jgi:outer membrane biosynthesis protein TonB
MHPSSGSVTKEELFLAGRKAAEENGAGVIGSLLLHGLAAMLVVFFVVKTVSQPPPKVIPFVAVDLVRLGMETESPPEARKSLVPQQRASAKQEAASPTRESVSPKGTKTPPVDSLEAKLRGLARLRQAQNNLKIAEGQGVSNIDAASGAPGERATYSVKDYVRAQVLRRWSLNLAKMAGRSFSIAIRVAMKRDGTIVSADIVEESRTKIDPLYRDIALSARNAVILSSPIALPPADLPAVARFTLDLDPKEAQH